MKLTNHAIIRSQQRNISIEAIRLLIAHGEPTEKPGNVMEYRIRRKDRDRLVAQKRQEIQVLERLSKIAAIVDGDYIITIYNLR